MKKCSFFTKIEQNGKRAVMLTNGDDAIVIPRTPTDLTTGTGATVVSGQSSPEIVVSRKSRSGLTRDVHVEGFWDIKYPNVDLGRIDIFYLNDSIVVTKRNEGVEVVDTFLPPISQQLYEIITVDGEDFLVEVPDGAAVGFTTKYYPRDIYLFGEKRVYPARNIGDRILVAGYITGGEKK